MKKQFIVTLTFLLVSMSLFAIGKDTRIDRGIGNRKSVYIKKGTLAGGVGGGYMQWDAADGAKLLGLVTDIDGKIGYGHAKAHVAWFFSNNWSVRGQFTYENITIDGNSLSAVGLLNLNNKHNRSENFKFSAGVRRYIPLFNSKVFALFAEGRLTGSRGYNKSYTETARGKEGTYSDKWGVAFEIISGISVFISDQVAFQASLPTFSAGLQWNKQLESQEKNSKIDFKGFTTRPNFLGITIGVTYHF